ncbi:MAG: hypothetical protein V8S98_05165 [Lachnospiraceae bacterium]
MTGTTYDIERRHPFKAKIPCITLNDLIMENAGQFDAPQITGPREKTGSTDFGNVMYDVPGCCIRTAFVPEGTSADSKEYLDAEDGQSPRNSSVLVQKFLQVPLWISWKIQNYFRK